MGSLFPFSSLRSFFQRRGSASTSSTVDRNVIDLDDHDSDVESSDTDVIDITEDDIDCFRVVESHDEEDVVLLEGLQPIARLNVNGMILQPSISVELQDGNFLFIRQILQDFSHGQQTRLQGYLIQRTRGIGSLISAKQNEVYVKQMIAAGQETTLSSAGYIFRPASEVLCVRDITFTNHAFPSHSFREVAQISSNMQSKQAIEECGKLVCRWVYSEFVDKKKVVGQELRILHATECDSGRGLSPEILLSRLLNEKKKEEESTRYDIDLTEGQTNTHSLSLARSQRRTIAAPITFRICQQQNTTPIKRYQYGEICAGGGGVSMAASKANLKIKFLLDNWHDACQTLRLNSQPAQVIEADIHDFCVNSRFSNMHAYYHVDMLWISYPCQPHSPANTRSRSKYESANADAMLSIEPLLKRAKPRIVLFEQTSGIWTHGGKVWLNVLIKQLTDAQYSISMMLLNAADFGNVQSRKRLFVVAAAPGQNLLKFPIPTHGHGPGLLPDTTMQSVLRSIPRQTENTPPHMLRYAIRRKRTRVRQCEARMTRIATITTKGIVNHPNGKRPLNIQELAATAGFISEHKFHNAGVTVLRRMIGNAVPFVMAKQVIMAAIAALESSDAALRAWKPEMIEIDG